MSGLVGAAVAPHHTQDVGHRLQDLEDLHQRHEEKYKKELLELKEKHNSEVQKLETDLERAIEIAKKHNLEVDLLKARLQQLEIRYQQNGGGKFPNSGFPSAIPSGLEPAYANHFVQTVNGIFYEPSTLPTITVVPPTTTTTNRSTRTAKDTAVDPSSRRASKRQKTTKAAAPMEASSPAPSQAAAPSEADTTTLEQPSTSHPPKKTSARIKVKPPVDPTAGEEDDDALDETGSHAGDKRPRSPGSNAALEPKTKKVKQAASSTPKNYHKVAVPAIPRDAENKPHMPLQIGPFLVLDRGRIKSPEDKAGPKVLYPIGYTCIRPWHAITGVEEAYIYYLCEILQGGDPQSPIFRVTPEDGEPHEGHTATAAWWKFNLAYMQKIGQTASPKIDGDQMFGLHEKAVRYILQDLPGAKEVTEYSWQPFVEVSPAQSMNTKKKGNILVLKHLPPAEVPIPHKIPAHLKHLADISGSSVAVAPSAVPEADADVASDAPQSVADNTEEA